LGDEDLKNLDVAVHRVESSENESDLDGGKQCDVWVQAQGRNKGKGGVTLNLDCFHTGISSEDGSSVESSVPNTPGHVTPHNTPILSRRLLGGLNVFPQ